MTYEYFGPYQFGTLHNQVVELGGHYRPLETTHFLGRSVTEHCISVRATLQPPTITETDIAYTKTPAGVLEDKTVKTISLEPDNGGQHVVVHTQTWDRRPAQVAALPSGEEEPRPSLVRGIRRNWAIDRILGGITGLLAKEEEVRDSDAYRR